jgi:hypothetical protein
VFFVAFGASMLAVLVAAFARSYFLRAPLGTPDLSGAPGLPLYLHVHGLMLTSWFVLFLVQAQLVSSGRVRTHRALGIAGVVLAIAIIPMSLMTVVRSIPRLPLAGFTPELINGVVVGDFLSVGLVFPALVAAAIVLRKRADPHKRLMVLACLTLWGPVGARLAAVFHPAVAIGFSELTFLVALGIYDFKRNRRVHPVTLWGGALLIGVRVGAVLASQTDAAKAFVAGL